MITGRECNQERRGEVRELSEERRGERRGEIEIADNGVGAHEDYLDLGALLGIEGGDPGLK